MVEVLSEECCSSIMDSRFNPYKQKSTNTQVWVKIYELPWEYWHKQILVDICQGIGMPLRYDQATLNGDFGYYARILVDIDLSSPPPDSIMIERDEVKFFVYIEYENLPAFCSNCSGIGHVPLNCRALRPKDYESRPPQGHSKARQEYKPKPPSVKINVENNEANNDSTNFIVGENENAIQESPTTGDIQMDNQKTANKFTEDAEHLDLENIESNKNIAENRGEDVEDNTVQAEAQSNQSKDNRTSLPTLTPRQKAAYDDLLAIANNPNIVEPDADDPVWTIVKKRGYKSNKVETSRICQGPEKEDFSVPPTSPIQLDILLPISSVAPPDADHTPQEKYSKSQSNEFRAMINSAFQEQRPITRGFKMKSKR